VLVVGASATGVQIAHEIQRSGRPVTLAVGEHVRGPREYRGRDIHWWMEAAGVLDERYDEVDDIVRARRVPSMQLAGSPERATFDLNALTGIGVRLAGRLAGIRDGRAQFSGSLRNKCELADLKLGRLLDTIDEWATANGLDDSVPPPQRCVPTTVPDPPLLGLDLRSGEIRTIVGRRVSARTTHGSTWTCSMQRFGPTRRWCRRFPGMFLIGMPFLRRRKSSFIDGARDDAQDLAIELAAYWIVKPRPGPPGSRSTATRDGKSGRRRRCRCRPPARPRTIRRPVAQPVDECATEGADARRLR